MDNNYKKSFDLIKAEVIKHTERIDKFGRSSFRYIGEKAVMNFNESGKFITGWLKNTKKVTK